MNSSLIARAGLILLVLALTAPLAVAQEEEEESPEERQARFSRLFDEGLQQLTDGEYAKSIETFKKCTELNPDSTASYYNVACAFSKWGKSEKALEWLEKSMEKGFLDFEHIAQDPDMDPIRELDAFKALIKKYQDQLMERFQYSFKESSTAGARPLFVVLHPNGSSADAMVEELAPHVNELGMHLAAPQGLSQNGPNMFSWTGLIDYTMPEMVKALRQKADLGDELVLAGIGDGAQLAMALALEDPERYSRLVLFNPGPLTLTEAADLQAPRAAGMKIYLVANGLDEDEQESLEQLRTQLLESGIEVSLRRPAFTGALPKDVGQLLRDAQRWFEGREAESGSL